MTQDKEKKIPIKRDVMFSCVMRTEKACKELLGLIFPEKKVEKIKYIGGPKLNPKSRNFELEIQKFLQFNALGKTVRLDVYFKDSDTVYNIEMQGPTTKGPLPLRARMYSSLIDANILERSMDYEKLIDSYVIFICTFDPFDRGKCIYRFQSTCEDEKDLCEGNKRYNIYLNTTGTRDDISFDLKEMFRYINGGETTIGMETKSEIVRTIDKYVQEYNANDSWRRGYMTFELLLQDNYKQGRAEGLAEAEAQYKAKEAKYKANVAQYKAKAKEEKANMIKDLYAKKVPIQTIAECGHLSEAEVQAIIASK